MEIERKREVGRRRYIGNRGEREKKGVKMRGNL